jgi:Protein of unknown function (DUF3180)
MGQPRNTEPSMGPTRPATLLVAALASAAVAWLAISQFYYALPRLPWLPALTLAALAVAEGIAAHSTKARIDRKPGRARIDPLLVARLVVLAKASSLAGSIFAGFYAGVTVWLLVERQRTAPPSEDLPSVIAGLVASILLVVAALWLERSCRVPELPDESDKMPSDQVS